MGSSPASFVFGAFFFFLGGVAEWFKASVLKTEKNCYSSWVRIPSPSLVSNGMRSLIGKALVS